jgi:hypothetical protein
MTFLRTSLFVAVLFGIGALALWVQHQTLVQIRDEHGVLQGKVSQLAKVAESNQAREARPVSSGEGTLTSELDRLRTEAEAQDAEIAKLRDQIAAIVIDPPPTNFPFSMMFINIPKRAWANVGYGTPENALETAVWAASENDMNSMLDSLTAKAQRKFDDVTADAVSGLLSAATDLQILKYEIQPDNRMHFTVYFDGLDQSNQPNWIDVVKTDDQWKIDSW